jgi:hypothetical protein
MTLSRQISNYRSVVSRAVAMMKRLGNVSGILQGKH